MYHLFFSQSAKCPSADGHIRGFHILAVVNSVVMGMGAHMSLGSLFSSPLETDPAVGLLDSMVVLAFYFCSQTFIYKELFCSLQVLFLKHTLLIS